MKMFSKSFAVVLILLHAIFALPACSPAFVRDAVTTVTSFATTILNWLSLATQAFQTVAPFLPDSLRPGAEDEFSKAVLAVRLALAALQDGTDTATAANAHTLTRAQLTKNIVDAVKNVTRVVDLYRGRSSVTGVHVGLAKDTSDSLHTMESTIVARAHDL